MKILAQLYRSVCGGLFPTSSPTVRYAFPLVFAVAALLTAAAVTSETSSFVHLESSVQSVKAGETFSIDVFVTAHVPINAVDIAISFPVEQIEVLGIDTGESVITLWTEEPYVKNDTVLLSGGTFRKGFLGEHRIATINVKASETGAAQFKVDSTTLLAGDGSGSKVKVTKTGDEEKQVFVLSDTEPASQTKEEGSALKSVLSVAIATDIDGDGNVTLADISRFMAAWNSKSALYDFSGDGAMTFRDFGIILAESFLR